MGAPKNPRKKSPKKELKFPNKATPKANNYFSTLMQTEEGRALRKQWSTKKRKNGGRPVGTPDGYTLEAITPIRKQAQKDAERIVAIMAKDNNIDDEYAVEALKTAVEIMREPAQNRDKLTAARMVLDFTKTKPVAKSEVTIGKAEAFLESLFVIEPQEEQTYDGKET
jgi:2-keto-4-pentenoate hydratase